MDLKKEIKPVMFCYMGSGMLTNDYNEGVAEKNADFCVKKAEEFAIGFSEWVENLSHSSRVSVWSDDGQHSGLIIMSTKRLLEKYKKHLNKESEKTSKD